jgi:hypothetical protein
MGTVVNDWGEGESGGGDCRGGGDGGGGVEKHRGGWGRGRRRKWGRGLPSIVGGWDSGRERGVFGTGDDFVSGLLGFE